MGEEGSVVVMITVATVALFAFAMVAIDGSILAAAKTQLENGADAAALAGAVEWAATGDEAAARQAAIDFASYNVAVRRNLESIRINPADVEILPGAGTQGEDRIRVRTFRTAEHGDALETYLLKPLDLAFPSFADIGAEATAEVFPVCRTESVKPWAILVRWEDENGNGVYDSEEPFHPYETGYLPTQDAGRALTLRPAGPGEAVSGHVYSVQFEGDTPVAVGPGDELRIDRGAAAEATERAWSELIAQDPEARWDEETHSVQGSRYGQSPRVVLVPFIHPPDPTTGETVRVSKVGAVFLESAEPAGRVNARLLRAAATGEPCEAPGSASFLVGIQLVE